MKEATSSFASEIEQMMKQSYGDNVVVDGGGVVSTAKEERKFRGMPLEIFKDILICLSNEKDYSVPDEPKKPNSLDKRQLGKYKNKMRKKANGFGLKKKAMLRSVWRMRNVSEGFREAYDSPVVMSAAEKEAFPRPTIGLRIMPKPAKLTPRTDDDFKVKVLLNIYGDASRKNFAHCIYPDEIAKTIFPCVVTTHLTIQGFVLSDGLIDMLKGFDTSSVEEVYINDISNVDLENYTVEDLVNLFPNALEIRFLGDASVTSLKNLFVDVPDLERVGLDDINTGELIKLYHSVDVKRYDRNRYNRNRRVFMRELANRSDSLEKRLPKENIIGSIMRMKKRLDNGHPKKEPSVELSDLELSSTGHHTDDEEMEE